ncbi:MAG: ribose-phosphate pyrophosphokinase [Nitriliruptor sp.]
MRIVAGNASRALGAAVATAAGTELVERRIERFPDGEIHVQLLEELRDSDTYLIQSTGPPSQEHLTELLLMADAAYRAGAARITAVVPYLAYARQDRRSSAGEPVGLRVVADVLRASHVDRLLVVDPHTPALESIVSMPVETTSAVPLLADALRDTLDGDTVLVAPDLGAAKLVDRYAELLDLEVAIVRKTRLSGDEVETGAVIGSVRGRRPVIVDDMVSTGGTIASAVEAVMAAGAVGPATVAATHSLLVGPAVERLRAVEVAELVTTDSLVVPAGDLVVRTVSLAERLAEVVGRLHRGDPLAELSAHG